MGSTRKANGDGLSRFQPCCDRTADVGFRTLLWGRGGPRTSDYRVRRALRALEDVGLMRIDLGPRGGMATTKCTWTARAYLAPARLAPDDEAAMEMLA